MDTVSSSQSTLESVLDDSTSEATTSDVNLNSDLLFSDRSKSVHYSEGERFTKEAIYCQSYPISFQYINSEKEIRVYSATDPEFLLYYKAVSPHHQLNETCLVSLSYTFLFIILNVIYNFAKMLVKNV